MLLTEATGRPFAVFSDGSWITASGKQKTDRYSKEEFETQLEKLLFEDANSVWPEHKEKCRREAFIVRSDVISVAGTIRREIREQQGFEEATIFVAWNLHNEVCLLMWGTVVFASEEPATFVS